MRTLGDMGEFGFIEHIRRILPSTPAVEEGIGDDCAVVRLYDHLVLASSDLFIEGIHFRCDYSPPNAIGWKAATAAISDIAAMGGAPLFCLVSIACPTSTTALFVEEMYHGLSSAVASHGAAIVGGDTTRHPTGVVIDVAVIGHVVTGRYLTRRGARAGDLLAVTGPLGSSAGGLQALQNNQSQDALVHAHLYPRARVEEGQWCCNHAAVHALIDVTDGIVQDAGHLTSNELGVNLRSGKIPMTPELTNYCAEHQLDPLALALSGGEDYELALAVDPDGASELIDLYKREFRSELHIIGDFTEAWTGVRIEGAEPATTGFDHFRPN